MNREEDDGVDYDIDVNIEIDSEPIEEIKMKEMKANSGTILVTVIIVILVIVLARTQPNKGTQNTEKGDTTDTSVVITKPVVDVKSDSTVVTLPIKKETK